MPQSLVLFQEAYFERIWGGGRLRTVLNRPAPADRPIGEAWLVSDHPTHESVALNGPWAGTSLHQLLRDQPDYLLGTLARPTAHGRFPLLLKLLDAADVLSVQVHPDDAAAQALGEPDIGKTEMWHVLDAVPGSELICGLDPAMDREAFVRATQDGSLASRMRRFIATAGKTAFVAAGTVHAIGAGILLAEIQQNSDLTYRIYDWDRADAQGNRRELHLQKAAQVTHFGGDVGGAAIPLSYIEEGKTTTVLGACRYFASDLVGVEGTRMRKTGGRSFHLVMPRDGAMSIQAGNEELRLDRCQAALVPGGIESYSLTGRGAVLVYYVPDLMQDVVAPLRGTGHPDWSIVQLGGASDRNDLADLINAEGSHASE